MNTPIAIVVLGVIIFAIAFFGCCGTCKDNKCMMYTYGFLLAVVLIAQVGGGIAAFAMKGDLEQEITKNMRGGLEHFTDPGYEGVTNTWNLVQDNFKCCGVENYKDWEKRYPTNGTAPGTVPDSCCKVEKENCGVRPDPSTLWADGCFSKFSQTFTDNLGYVGSKYLISFWFLNKPVFCIFSCCGLHRCGGAAYHRLRLLPREEDGKRQSLCLKFVSSHSNPSPASFIHVFSSIYPRFLFKWYFCILTPIFF